MQGWMFRHGATYGNTQKRYIGTTDEPLIKEERTDLPAAAEKWKKLGLIPADVPVVFTSPMLRCRETASLFYPHAEQVVIDSLRECDFGDFENKNYLELSGNPDYQRWIDSGGTLPFPHGESGESFRSRCCDGFTDVLRESMQRTLPNLMLFVHGGTIMSILELYGVPARRYYDWHVANGEGWKFSLSADWDSLTRPALHVEREITRTACEEKDKDR